METKERFKTAIKEEANVLGLAGAAALSLVLLNPIPLVIGIVAEVAYLLYIPDSRWFSSRLSTKFDGEIIKHRRALQEKVYPLLTEEVRNENISLENLREQLNEVPINTQEQKHWREFLRQVDYLLDLTIQISGKQSAIPSVLEPKGASEKDPLIQESPEITERRRLLEHYEAEAQSLKRLASKQTDPSRHTILMRSVADLERETHTMQQELFQLLTAQHLADSVRETMQSTHGMLFQLAERLHTDDVDLTSLYANAHKIVQGAEHISVQQNNWVKQANPLLKKK